MQQQQQPQQQQQQQQPQSMYGSHPHTPRTPGTPNPGTPTSNAPTNGTHNAPNGGNPNPQAYQPQTSQAPGRGGHYAMAPQPYGAPHQNYATSGAMMPQTTATASHPQPIAPAPAGNRAPPMLRPMPPQGMPGGMQPLPHGPQGHMMPTAEWKNPGWQGMPQPQENMNEPPPTHVVGSQGRRGVLPSAPGRPPAPAAGTTGKSTVIPVKDADGKFPCPHCTKTYLHAKHLKRHLLRHTGDRPYMCVLCRDTFSRSDILKRHFQKCSIRRGNPTGASHLSHPLAHVRKQPQNQQPPPQRQEGDLSHVNGMNNMPPQDGMGHQFGMMPVNNDPMNNMSQDQNHLSRSSSMGNSNTPDRRSMPGPPMGTSQYPSDVSNNMNNQQMPYSMAPSQNGMPMYGGSNQNQQSNLDWSQMFQAGAHSTLNHSPSFPPNLGQTQIATKTELKLEPYPTTDKRTQEPLIYHEWGVPSNIRDPYARLSNQILDFFYPPNQTVDPNLTGMNLYFDPDNIKDFVHQYTHFHVHTPILHVPTFRIMEVPTVLLVAMCCIGACYSDRVGPGDVRAMMDATWVAMANEPSSMMSSVVPSSNSPDATPLGIQKMQAFLLMTILHFWNGTPDQREKARRSFSSLASQARALNLLHLIGDPQRQSYLHRADVDISQFGPAHFDWRLWVDQEARIRLMLGIYICDTAMGLYFNAAAQFDPFEIHLPLPADDAAWDAHNADIAASALALRSSELAQVANAYGTRRSKQPELDRVLRTLLHSSYDIHPGSTNIYGKFVIIHALIDLIRRAQIDGRVVQLQMYDAPPMRDWMKTGSGNNGRTTPVIGVAQDIDTRSLEALSFALDKFKDNWDLDMEAQFPPQESGVNNPQRQGFSRDAIHFFWLAKYLLKFTEHEELQLGPDARLGQVIGLLKGVRKWVMTDGLSRGEELGSIGEIDDQFGLKDLTLDMAQLFKPLPHLVESGGPPSVKKEFVSA